MGNFIKNYLLVLLWQRPFEKLPIIFFNFVLFNERTNYTFSFSFTYNVWRMSKGQWKNVHVIYASSNNDNAARDRNNSTKWNGCCAANLRQRGGKLNCERMIMRILYKAPEYDVKRTVKCQSLFYKVKVKLNAKKLTKMISRILWLI